MIPNTIHFVKTDRGSSPFGFINFLAVISAWKVNRPEKILLHCASEPYGPWWDKAKPYLTLRRITPPDEIFGNPVRDYAHKADVLRLQILKEFGGIYLDLDVICVNPFLPLLQHDVVMGKEANHGLGAAVILSIPDSEFINIWYEEYKDFDDSQWGQHSVKLPLRLAREHPELIHVEGPYSFFYPMYYDPGHALWDTGRFSETNIRGLAWVIKRNAKVHIKNVLTGRQLVPYPPVSHFVRTKAWHFGRLCSAYSLHIYQRCWWSDYLRDYSLASIFEKKTSDNFSRLIRRIFQHHDLERLYGREGPH